MDQLGAVPIPAKANTLQTIKHFWNKFISRPTNCNANTIAIWYFKGNNHKKYRNHQLNHYLAIKCPFDALPAPQAQQPPKPLYTPMNFFEQYF